jgi:hypothetical protein
MTIEVTAEVTAEVKATLGMPKYEGQVLELKGRATPRSSRLV